MVQLRILDGDLGGLGLVGKDVVEGQLEAVVGFREGTVGGAASVVLLVELSDGRVVVGQTSLALFVSAARALVARYGDPSGEVRVSNETRRSGDVN